MFDNFEIELLSIDFYKVDMSKGSDPICRYNKGSKLFLTSGVITDWEMHV